MTTSLQVLCVFFFFLLLFFSTCSTFFRSDCSSSTYVLAKETMQHWRPWKICPLALPPCLNRSVFCFNLFSTRDIEDFQYFYMDQTKSQSKPLRTTGVVLHVSTYQSQFLGQRAVFGFFCRLVCHLGLFTPGDRQHEGPGQERKSSGRCFETLWRKEKPYKLTNHELYYVVCYKLITKIALCLKEMTNNRTFVTSFRGYTSWPTTQPAPKP